MRTIGILVAAVAALTLAGFQSPQSRSRHPVIAMERTALDRWGKGDPQGYLEIYAPDVTYFDPFQERRIDGLDTMQKLYGPIKGMVKVDSFNMIAPNVHERGDVAVLTYNLVSYARDPKGEPITVRWNSTEVYARSRGKWSIIHSHWSFTRPGQQSGP